MPVSTHANNHLDYHAVTSHHNWNGQSHHNLKKPHNDHKVLTIIVAIVILVIIVIGLICGAGLF